MSKMPFAVTICTVILAETVAFAAQPQTGKVVVAPSAIDFGIVPAGNGMTRDLAVKLPVGGDAGATVSVKSSNPDVSAAHIPPDPYTKTQFRAPKYRVSLSPKARLGTITGTLTVVESL